MDLYGLYSDYDYGYGSASVSSSGSDLFTGLMVTVVILLAVIAVLLLIMTIVMIKNGKRKMPMVGAVPTVVTPPAFSAVPTVCKNCGRPLTPGSTFCSECGFNNKN